MSGSSNFDPAAKTFQGHGARVYRASTAADFATAATHVAADSAEVLSLYGHGGRGYITLVRSPDAVGQDGTLCCQDGATATRPPVGRMSTASIDIVAGGIPAEFADLIAKVLRPDGTVRLEGCNIGSSGGSTPQDSSRALACAILAASDKVARVELSIQGVAFDPNIGPVGCTSLAKVITFLRSNPPCLPAGVTWTDSTTR